MIILHKLFLLTAPSEPMELSLLYLGETSINVSWSSPIFPNGPITDYIVSVVAIVTG